MYVSVTVQSYSYQSYSDTVVQSWSASSRSQHRQTDSTTHCNTEIVYLARSVSIQYCMSVYVSVSVSCVSVMMLYSVRFSVSVMMSVAQHTATEIENMLTQLYEL